MLSALALPVAALLLSVVAAAAPGPFVALKPTIPWLLGAVMLSMGLTLRPAQFQQVVRRPRVVILGLALQFICMPALAWLIVTSVGLPKEVAAGVILVGCCPGGTASNVIAFLARADVALSITLTTLATLLAVLLTPVLTTVLVGTRIQVNGLGLLLSVIKMVLIPVALGVLVNYKWGARISVLRRWAPVFASGVIVLIIAIIVALTRSLLVDMGGRILLAVAAHNAGGLGLGYLGARLFGFGEAQRRTVAIEVGMQNSGLAVALATAHMTALAALPGAVFSVWHNVTGALMAAIWQRKRASSPARFGDAG